MERTELESGRIPCASSPCKANEPGLPMSTEHTANSAKRKGETWHRGPHGGTVSTKVTPAKASRICCDLETKPCDTEGQTEGHRVQSVSSGRLRRDSASCCFGNILDPQQVD